jgi:hypothetical protein
MQQKKSRDKCRKKDSRQSLSSAQSEKKIERGEKWATCKEMMNHIKIDLLMHYIRVQLQHGNQMCARSIECLQFAASQPELQACRLD